MNSCRLNLSQVFNECLPFEVMTRNSAEPDRRRNLQCLGRLTRLPIDIFGTAFVFLSRYEEFVDRQRDEHDR